MNKQYIESRVWVSKVQAQKIVELLTKDSVVENAKLISKFSTVIKSRKKK